MNRTTKHRRHQRARKPLTPIGTHDTSAFANPGRPRMSLGGARSPPCVSSHLHFPPRRRLLSIPPCGERFEAQTFRRGQVWVALMQKAFVEQR